MGIGDPLPNSSQRLKGVQFSSIEENRYACSGHTTHDQVNQHLGKVECFEDFMDETPFEMIVSFSKIHFDCHETTFPFFY